MTIHVTPIPSTIELTAPAFVLGDTNVAGDTGTAVASNSTLAAMASQAQMAAASSNAFAASPGRTQYHPGVAKGWSYWNAAGVAQAGYNVSSVTVSSSVYTVTWTTAFSTNDYSVVATSATGASRHAIIHDIQTTFVQVLNFTDAGVAIAADSGVAAFGVQ